MKKRHYFAAAVAMAGFIALNSCSDSDSGKNEFKPIQLNTKSRATAEQLECFYVEFAKDAFKYVDSSVKEGQTRPMVVVSPLSASMALGMYANGVDARTQDGIVGYLGVDDVEGINTLSESLLDKLPDIDRKSDLRLANSVWSSSEYTLNSGFSSVMTGSYDAQVRYVDFNDSENARASLNRWAASATGNMIPEFLKTISQKTYFILANAVCFQSQWADKYFDKSKTISEIFHGLNEGAPGEVKDNLVQKVPMMHSSTIEEVPYANDGDFEYASIPFGNGAFSISFLLPREGLHYDDALELLDISRYNSLVAGSSNRDIRLVMPRLDIKSSVDISGMLASRGISLQPENISLFTEPVPDIIISSEQSVCLTLDESGVKVAAVTYDEGIALDPTPTEPYTLELNRPFIFFITEQSTNACIIAGRVLDFQKY